MTAQSSEGLEQRQNICNTMQRDEISTFLIVNFRWYTHCCCSWAYIFQVLCCCVVVGIVVIITVVVWSLKYEHRRRDTPKKNFILAFPRTRWIKIYVAEWHISWNIFKIYCSFSFLLLVHISSSPHLLVCESVTWVQYETACTNLISDGVERRTRRLECVLNSHWNVLGARQRRRSDFSMQRFNPSDFPAIFLPITWQREEKIQIWIEDMTSGNLRLKFYEAKMWSWNRNKREKHSVFVFLGEKKMEIEWKRQKICIRSSLKKYPSFIMKLFFPLLSHRIAAMFSCSCLLFSSFMFSCPRRSIYVISLLVVWSFFLEYFRQFFLS